MKLKISLALKNIQVIVLIILFFSRTTVLALVDRDNAPTNEEILSQEDFSNASDVEKKEFELLIRDLFTKRNKAVLMKDTEGLKEFYDLKIKVSQWAYESEIKKVKYLENWSEKQSIIFDDIDSIIKVNKVKSKGNGIYGIICAVASQYTYYYTDTPDIKNKFGLATYHYLTLQQDGDKYIITKEWYTDPFADSLELKNIKSEEVKEYILSQTKPEISTNEKLQKALTYAHTYCGVNRTGEYIFKYNKKYKNFNPEGGDCANFASQILYEGGGFKKNNIWNYEKGDGTKAWVNAQGFKNYMVGSGRASYIAKGSYQKTYKSAFKMKPGDFVAYEKKGRIVHISTVTGLDSKGYPLVTCHNTDRLLVPYDLGWSNDNITFHLIHVHY